MSFFRTLRAAFLAPANLIGLFAASSAALVTGEPTPLLVALSAEGVYLGLTGASRRFRRAVRASGAGDERRLPAAPQPVGEELSTSQADHYRSLNGLRDRILANYEKLPGGRVLAASSQPRLDALLGAFLRLLTALNAYREYLGASDRRRLEEELAQLEVEANAEANPRLKEVKGKRVEILRKRVQRFEQAQESRELISHQLAGIEDLLRLTHEQSIAIRDPEAVGRQLDALSAEVAASEETVQELEQFLDVAESMGSSPPQRVR